MKNEALWVVGGLGVVGAITAIYFATRKSEAPAPPVAHVSPTSNAPEGAQQPPTIQDLQNIATALWGNQIDWTQKKPLF